MAEPRVKAREVKCPACKAEASQLCRFTFSDLHTELTHPLRDKSLDREIRALVGTPKERFHHERIATAAAWSKKKATTMKQKVMFDELAQLECRVCGMRYMSAPKGGKCGQCQNVNSLFHCSKEAKKEALVKTIAELDEVIDGLD